MMMDENHNKGLENTPSDAAQDHHHHPLTIIPSPSHALPFALGVSWDRAVQFIRAHHAAVLPSVTTLTVYIPSTCVGAVIGRRGSTVAALQKSAAQAAQTPHPVRVSVLAHHTSTAAANANNSSGTMMMSMNNFHSNSMDNNTNNPSSPENPTNASTTTNTAAGDASSSNSPAPSAAASSPHHQMLGGDNNDASFQTFTPLDWSDPAWTPVVIRGDALAMCHAAQGLVELIAPKAQLAVAAAASNNTSTAASGGGNNHHPNSTNNVAASTTTTATTTTKKHTFTIDAMSLWMDQVICDIPLARQKHGILVGKRGQMVAALSADTQVRIMIPQKQARLDMIQLEGDLYNVLVCLANIVALLTMTEANKNATASSTSKQ